MIKQQVLKTVPHMTWMINSLKKIKYNYAEYVHRVKVH